MGVIKAPGAAIACVELTTGGGVAVFRLPAAALARRRAELAGLVAPGLDDFLFPDEGLLSRFFAARLFEEEERALVEARSQAL